MADRDDEDDEKDKSEEAIDSDLEVPATVSHEDLDSPVPKADTDEDLESEERDSADAGRQALDPTASEEIANEAETTERQKNMEDRQAAAIAKAEDMVNTPDEAPEKPAESAAPQSDETSAAVATRPSSKYEDLVNQYQNLIDQRHRADTTNALVQAGSKIGQSMAGKYSGNFVPDPSQAKVLGDLANRPVTDFEQGLAVQGTGMKLAAEMAASDPASPQSKLVRDYLNQRLKMNLGPDVSANDAAMLMKTLGRPVMTKYQKVTGTYTDPATGETKRVSASYDPTTRQYTDETGKPLPGFVQESLAPIEYTKDSKGNIVALNKGAITQNPQVVSSSTYAPVSKMTPQQVENFRPDQPQQKALDDAQKSLDSQNKMRSETLDQIDKAERMLNSGSKLTAANMPIMMVPISSGLKRVNTYELDAWSGAKDLASRVDQWVATHADSELTPENKAEFTNLLAQYKQSVNNASLSAQQRAAQHLELTRSIPSSFSAKALGVQQAPSNNSMIPVTLKKTGKSMMLPSDKVDEARKQGLIN
jgi:hypothetical protein